MRIEIGDLRLEIGGVLIVNCKIIYGACERDGGQGVH